MFWLSLSYKSRDALWPQGIIIGLFLLCIKYIADGFKEIKPAGDRNQESGAAKYRVWGSIILTVGYLFLCNWAGFYVSTAVFMIAVLLALGERNWVVLSVVPIATTFMIYLVFFLFLRIPLPTGILF